MRQVGVPVRGHGRMLKDAASTPCGWNPQLRSAIDTGRWVCLR